MEEIGIKALNWIVDTIQKWLDQAPAYIVDLTQRYWLYYWWEHLLWALFCFINVLLCLWWIKKWAEMYKEDDESAWAAIVTVCSMIWLIALVLTAAMIGQAIKWFYIPEIAIINEISSIWCR